MIRLVSVYTYEFFKELSSVSISHNIVGNLPAMSTIYLRVVVVPVESI